jgi:hypothetical protein
MWRYWERFVKSCDRVKIELVFDIEYVLNCCMKQIHLSKFHRTILALIFLLFGVLCQENDANAAEWFDVPGLVWGPADTNNVRIGIYSDGTPASNQITVFLLIPTNAIGNYLTPPDLKFSKIVLSGPDGHVLSPKPNKRIYRELPNQIAVSKMPRVPMRGSRQRGSGGWLKNLITARPETLNSFLIQDVFQINKEGEYTITIFAAVYGFPPNKSVVMSLPPDQQFVTRIDLPPVTKKVHLVP